MKPQDLAIAAVRQLANRPRMTTWIAKHTSWEDPFSEERSRYPYPVFEREREHGPIYWNRLYNTWTVLGWAECQQVLASPDFSTSAGMARLSTVTPYRKLSHDSLAFVQNLLVFLDGDTHARLRSLVSRTFTPRRVSALQPRIDQIATALLGQIRDQTPASGRTVDLVDEFTARLPVQVIGELLGVPPARWTWLQETSEEITKLLDPIRGFEPTEMEAAIGQLRGYILALADARRHAGGADLISGLVGVEEEGERLDEHELVSLVAVLLLAGTETTTGLLGNAIVHLDRYRDQRRLLMDNPDLWPNAIEELIRYDPPVIFAPRTALRTTRIGSAEIKPGQTVEVLIGAANRDPRRYDAPETLDVTRADPSPLSFGHGIHYCIGATLARATAHTGLRRFLEEFPDYDCDLPAVKWRSSATLRGPVSLPVRVT